MSRLIIKNLPPYYKDTHLRNLLTPSKSDLTDIKIIHTQGGRSRQFAFVGLRTQAAANALKKRLHNTYVATSKITVETARAVGSGEGDKELRPWSKYSRGSSAYEKGEDGERKIFLEKEKKRLQKLMKEKRKAQAKGAEKVNEQRGEIFETFEEVAAKRSANPVWADGALKQDTTLVESRKKGGEGKFLERTHVVFGESDEEGDLYEALPEGAGERKEEEAGDDVALNHAVSDMDYFKSKVVKEGDKEDKENKENEENNNAERDVDYDEDRGNHEDGNQEENSSDEKGKDGDKSSQDEDEQNRGVPAQDSDERSAPKRIMAPVHQRKHESDGVDAGETGRLLIRNLPFITTEADLETLLEQHGNLSDIHIVRDSQNRTSRGIAFAQFTVPQQAVSAMLELDGKIFAGRLLHVLPAKPRPETKRNMVRREAGGSTFKSDRDEKRRELARSGDDSAAQHAFHIAPDAVATVAAEKHGVSKAELLGTAGGESGEAAVRLAMAEATLQSEAKTHLMKNGIDLGVAARTATDTAGNTMAAKRKRMSRTAFLLKNLPGRTGRKDIEVLMKRFGELKRVVVVPGGVLAVAEFMVATDAKSAYNGLAYTKFRDTPLYLEWLPTEALKEVRKTGDESDSDGVEDKPKRGAKGDEKAAQANGNNDVVSSASVYVKNLNFDTHDQALLQHFKQALRRRPQLVGALRSAKIARKRKEASTEKLSMGFGFLEFATATQAQDAVKLVQNTSLDGHTLHLSISNKSETSDSTLKKRKRTKEGKPSAKLIVRNLAFEATKRDVRQLFSAFGEIKTVRLPKRMDGSHRGFAFVEYASKTEARGAFEGLTNAHLYGRHLVLAYAEGGSGTDMSIEEMQQRAARRVSKRGRMVDGNIETNEEVDELQLNEDDMAQVRDAMYV